MTNGIVRITAKKDQTVTQLREMLEVLERNGKGECIVKVRGREIKDFMVSDQHRVLNIR